MGKINNRIAGPFFLYSLRNRIYVAANLAVY